MSGCRCGQCRHDRGRADLQYHAGYQLPGVAAEEGLAERRFVDHQGQHEPAEAPILDEESVAGSREKPVREFSPIVRIAHTHFFIELILSMIQIVVLS